MDYNLTLGKGKDAQQISSNDLKGGVRKDDIEDKKMRSIFEALDNGNGILEENEVNQLKAKVQEAAAKDGDATNLSNKEAKSLIKSLGLKGFKAEDVFRFLGIVKEAGVYIDYQTTDAKNPDEIVIKYNNITGQINKYDKNGKNLSKKFADGDMWEFKYEYHKDGSYTKNIIFHTNGLVEETGQKIEYDKDGRELCETSKDGQIIWKNEYNKNGSYTTKYTDGDYINYDKFGRETSGQLDGESWTRKYHKDGSCTEKYSSGEVIEYDKFGRQLNGQREKGITWTKEYNTDGSYTKKYSNGESATYDKKDRELSRILDDGTTWKNEYHEDGSYTRTYSNGGTQEFDHNGNIIINQEPVNSTTWEDKTHEDGSSTRTYSDGKFIKYDKNGKEMSGKLADGTTWVNEQNGNGSYTSTYSNGEIITFDKDGKQLSRKLADGTVYGADGNIKYTEAPKEDGSKDYWGTDNSSYASKTANGNFRVSPKQGETFDDTMNRLGITDSADQELFKKANPKAYTRGYFLLTSPDNPNYDVYIPKELADKLNVENMLVDASIEIEKHKQARKAPHMGI